MDKQSFLDGLRNGKIAAAQNRAELNRLPENAFQPFDEGLPIVEHNFSAEYFHEQCSKSRMNFAKYRCEHLIDVKAKMQEMGVEGFVISESNQQAIKAALQLNHAVEERLAKFKPSTDFQAAIIAKDINLVRAFISQDLNSERVDASDVGDLVWYTQRNLPEAFEKYEQDSKFRKPINEDVSVWSFDYFINQQSPLNANFALERVLHLIDVRAELRQRGVPEFQKLGTTAPKTETIRAANERSAQHQAEPHRKQPEHRQQHLPNEQEHSSPLKTAMMITGGILALIALAIAILK